MCVCPNAALPKRNSFPPNLLLRVALERYATQWSRRSYLRGGSGSRLFSGRAWYGVVAVAPGWLMLHGRTGLVAEEEDYFNS